MRPSTHSMRACPPTRRDPARRDFARSQTTRAQRHAVRRGNRAARWHGSPPEKDTLCTHYHFGGRGFRRGRPRARGVKDVGRSQAATGRLGWASTTVIGIEPAVTAGECDSHEGFRLHRRPIAGARQLLPTLLGSERHHGNLHRRARPRPHPNLPARWHAFAVPGAPGAGIAAVRPAIGRARPRTALPEIGAQRARRSGVAARAPLQPFIH